MIELEKKISEIEEVLGIDDLTTVSFFRAISNKNANFFSRKHQFPLKSRLFNPNYEMIVRRIC